MKIGKYERDFMNWKLIEENCFCGVRKQKLCKKKNIYFYDPLELEHSLFNKHFIIWNISKKIVQNWFENLSHWFCHGWFDFGNYVRPVVVCELVERITELLVTVEEVCKFHSGTEGEKFFYKLGLYIIIGSFWSVKRKDFFFLPRERNFLFLKIFIFFFKNIFLIFDFFKIFLNFLKIIFEFFHPLHFKNFHLLFNLKIKPNFVHLQISLSILLNFFRQQFNDTIIVICIWIINNVKQIITMSAL